MDSLLLTLLRKEFEIVENTVTASASMARISGANPDRWGVCFLPPNNATVEFSFWDPATGQPRFSGGTTQSFVTLTEDDIGGLITYPINARCPSGTGTLGVVEMVYNQRAKEILRRVWNKYLSDIGAL